MGAEMVWPCSSERSTVLKKLRSGERCDAVVAAAAAAAAAAGTRPIAGAGAAGDAVGADMVDSLDGRDEDAHDSRAMGGL